METRLEITTGYVLEPVVQTLATPILFVEFRSAGAGYIRAPAEPPSGCWIHIQLSLQGLRYRQLGRCGAAGPWDDINSSRAVEPPGWGNGTSTLA